ncbi:MAG TPA: hypothetical protein VJ802_05965 [Gemmatimonadaceae bacterium]|nr:hypothetical protein [Gemmatimonadaceae bacterium]
MRALLSWDVAANDPALPSILIAIADCFPAQKLETLTNQTARANKITQKQFVDINDRLQTLAAQYAGRMFYVFSLHSESDPIYGTFRPTGVGPNVVAGTPGGG